MVKYISVVRSDLYGRCRCDDVFVQLHSLIVGLRCGHSIGIKRFVGLWIGRS